MGIIAVVTNCALLGMSPQVQAMLQDWHLEPFLTVVVLEVLLSFQFLINFYIHIVHVSCCEIAVWCALDEHYYYYYYAGLQTMQNT